MIRAKLLAGINDLETYTARAFPAFQWWENARVLARRLEQVASGEIKRLIVFMPPRHGKSEMVSRMLPGYFLSKNPDKWVGLASYGAELAEELSEQARDNMLFAGFHVNPKTKAKNFWRTTGRGGMWAVGVAGATIGRGTHLAIIDDPIKNQEEANSETDRKKKKEWFESTLSSRLEKDAAIVIMQQRWHTDDLAGSILTKEQENYDAGLRTQGWHIIDFSAIYGEWDGDGWVEPPPRRDIPPTCTLEPDWRKPGDALCEGRVPLEELLDKRDNMSLYYWSAMYQQRPVPREGALFKEEWFDVIPVAPSQGKTIRFWDRAASTRGDWTVGTKIRKSPEGFYYILDVVRGRWRSGERDKIIANTAIEDGIEVKQFGEQEPGAAGKDSAKQFEAMMADIGRSGKCAPASGDKEVRADPMASAAETGKVKLVEHPHGKKWTQVWLDEVCVFPFGAHDDQVDSASGAFNKLSRKGWIYGVFGGFTSPNQWDV